MRVFIAVPFDLKTKKTFAGIQKELIDQSTSGKFAEWSNFHLTIKFIGEVTEKEVKKIHNALSSIVETHQPFTLIIGGVDGFMKGQTMIPWLSVKDGKEKLHELNKDVEDVLDDQGFSREERPYQSHMTLGRKVLIKKDSWSKFIHDQESTRVKIPVSSIVLMESTRQEGKLVYQVLKEYLLSG